MLAEQYNEKQQEKVKDLISLAWHIEAFARHKKLPRLKTLLRNIGKNNAVESKSDMILKAMAADKGVIV